MRLDLFAWSILDMRLLAMMPQLAVLSNGGGYLWVRTCSRQQMPQLYLLMTMTGPP